MNPPAPPPSSNPGSAPSEILEMLLKNADLSDQYFVYYDQQHFNISVKLHLNFVGLFCIMGCRTLTHPLF